MSISFWTDEIVEVAVALWKDGLTASEVGEKIGATRNMVIGKMHRLKIGADQRQISPARVKPIARYGEAWSDQEVDTLRQLRQQGRTLAQIAKALGRSQKSVEKKVVRLKVEKIKAPVIKIASKPKPRPVAPSMVRPDRVYSLFELRPSTCHFPFGDPRDDDFGFCGQPVSALDRPYCACHRAVVYQPSAPRKTAAKPSYRPDRRAA